MPSIGVFDVKHIYWTLSSQTINIHWTCFLICTAILAPSRTLSCSVVLQLTFRYKAISDIELLHHPFRFHRCTIINLFLLGARALMYSFLCLIWRILDYLLFSGSRTSFYSIVINVHLPDVLTSYWLSSVFCLMLHVDHYGARMHMSLRQKCLEEYPGSCLRAWADYLGGPWDPRSLCY